MVFTRSTDSTRSPFRRERWTQPSRIAPKTLNDLEHMPQVTPWIMRKMLCQSAEAVHSSNSLLGKACSPSLHIHINKEETSDKDKKETMEYFNNFVRSDYAAAGFIANKTMFFSCRVNYNFPLYFSLLHYFISILDILKIYLLVLVTWWNLLKSHYTLFPLSYVKWLEKD